MNYVIGMLNYEDPLVVNDVVEASREARERNILVIHLHFFLPYGKNYKAKRRATKPRRYKWKMCLKALFFPHHKKL